MTEHYTIHMETPIVKYYQYREGKIAKKTV